MVFIQSLTSRPRRCTFIFLLFLYFPPVSEAGLDPSGELAATVQEVAVTSKLRQKAASLDKHQVCCGAAVWDRAER